MVKSLPRAIATLGVCAGLFLVAPAASGAGLARSHHGGNATTTTTLANSPKTYRQAHAAYVAAREVIAQNFKNAVDAAQAAFVASRASATTGAQRSTARAAYALAIAQAAAARSAALISLGNPPTRPN
jgi:hypothetical protein